MNPVKIIKANGEEVLFKRDKFVMSLKKTGASKEIIQKIIDYIETVLYERITTKEIYKKAFKELKNHSSAVASRYKLKKAIIELGPTGYPFEKFVGELLKHLGYRVEVGVIVQGHCVQHEVDVIAEKDNKHFMIECKFHSSFKTKCSVKIPLYIQSRFLDIRKKWVRLKGHQQKFHQGWVVNNTRFSEDAIQYGTCVGLNLISWDYPENGGIKHLIGISGLYPVTCLHTLKKHEKLKLIKKDIVLCRHLCENSGVLIELGIPQNRRKHILEDAQELCKNILP